MMACNLHGGDHLCGLLPPVPGIRDDFAIPVVRRIRRKISASGQVLDVLLRWPDGTSCHYPPNTDLPVLEVAS